MKRLYRYLLDRFHLKDNSFNYCNIIQKVFEKEPLHTQFMADLFTFMSLTEVQALTVHLKKTYASRYAIYIGGIRSVIDNTFKYKSATYIKIYIEDSFFLNGFIEIYQELLRQFPNEMAQLRIKYIRGDYAHYSEATKLVHKIK